MKTTEGDILRKAFRLFLEKNYEKVTVQELERVTGISRGGIFHYMGNKKGLFNKVVNKYIFEVTDIYDRLLGSIDVEKVTLRDFIDVYISEIDKSQSFLLAESGRQFSESTRDYYRFLLQADAYYPNFKEIMNKRDLNVFHLWKAIIERAIELGEIKNGIDPPQLVHLFRYTYFGMLYGTVFVDDAVYVEKMVEYFNFIYSLVKK
jgi:AcrR family transcriptional regulator